MKIVIVGPAYPLRGGNALFVAHLYEALRATNEVHVVSYSRLYPGFLFPGVRQTDVSTVAMKEHPATPIIDCLNPVTWFQAARKAASLRADMLVLTWWNPFFGFVIRTIAGSFKRATGAPVVIIAENVVSHEARWIDSFLTHVALSTADRFLVLSGVVEETVKKLFPGTRVFRSSLPVYDCYKGSDQLTPADAKRRLGLEGKSIVLFFGYVRQYKGLMNLLEAFPSIRRSIPDAHLLVVGEFYDDPEPYLSAIRKLGIASNVTIINSYVPNETVHLYFTAANLAVLPYNEATQSGILSIAYGFAKPVIVTNVGGLAELVDDGQTGYVVQPHDVPALASAVIRYFAERREEEFSRHVAEKREENGFSRIRDVFEEIRMDLQPNKETRGTVD